jgi:hypothetical protein
MRDEEFDRLIDAGLSKYAEPRAGIEQRVLAAIAAEREGLARRPAWRMWALGLSGAACVLIGLLIAVRFANKPHTHDVQTAHATAPAAAPHAVPRTTRPQHPAMRTATPASSRAHRPVHPQSLPKKDIFPTPQPLNPEMQALVTYLAHAPEKDRQQLAEFQAQQDAPIRIPPIHITPVDASAKD